MGKFCLTFRLMVVTNKPLELGKLNLAIYTLDMKCCFYAKEYDHTMVQNLKVIPEKFSTGGICN
jgi:hypothetical protein